MRVASAVALGIAAFTGAAGGASAAPAVFNVPSGNAGWNLYHNPLTITIGASPGPVFTAICNPASFYDAPAFSNSGSPLQGTLGAFTVYGAPCGGAAGWVDIVPRGPFRAEKNGSTFSLTSATSLEVTFYGGPSTKYGPNAPFTIPWTNATGPGTYSVATFSSTQVGITSTGQPVKLTGALVVIGGPPRQLTLS